jgi:1,4-dihydroxy-2-naphthoyl-CoA synthase
VIRAGEAPGVRSVVITAAGERFFSTGGDVNDYHLKYSDDMIGMRSYERALERVFAEIIHCPKPVIHRINGDVVGGANAFHLAADFAVMAKSAKLQQVGSARRSVAGFRPDSSGGRSPSTTSGARHPDVPEAGDLGARAGMGAVNTVVETAGLDAAVDDLVNRLAGILRMRCATLRWR